MNNVSITIDASRFQRFLGEAPGKVGLALKNIISKVAFLVEREGKTRSPVDTGRLRASIATDLYPMTATVHTNTNYAIYVHDGTRFVRPRPFMSEAVGVVENEVEKIMTDELKVLE